jgi:hypothetical protein
MAVAAQRELPDKILSWTTALAGVAVGVQAVAHGVNAGVLDWSVELLNADYDHSVFGWCSEVAAFAGVPGALLLSVLRPARRGMFLLLAAALAFLSLDDAVFIHERVGELDTSLGLGEYGGRLVWPVLYLPILAGTLLLLVGAGRELGGRFATLLMAAAGLFVLAVVLEGSSYALVKSGYDLRDWPFVIEVAIEEGAELAGWILCAGALVAAPLRETGGRQDPELRPRQAEMAPERALVAD